MSLAGNQGKGLQDHRTQPVAYLRMGCWLLEVSIHWPATACPLASVNVLIYLALLNKSHHQTGWNSELGVQSGVLVSEDMPIIFVLLLALTKLAANVTRLFPHF